jgi:hypothetical protein
MDTAAPGLEIERVGDAVTQGSLHRMVAVAWSLQLR